MIRQSDWHFLKEVKHLVIPSILQMLVANSFSFINMLMVSSLGDGAVAITAAAGKISFVLMMILSAVFGMTAYITQFYGQQQHKMMRATFGFMCIISIIISIIVFGIVFLWKVPMLALFIKDSAYLPVAIQYIQILSFTFVIGSIRDAYAHALGSIGKIRITLYVGLVAMLVNIILDYGLIYGKLGMPELGVTGAAWSTLAAISISLISYLFIVYQFKMDFNLKWQEWLFLTKRWRKQIIKVISPLIVHEGMWSIGNMLYAVAFGAISISALATFQLANTLQGYFMMAIYGFAYAAKVMIGQQLGKNHRDAALAYAQNFTRLSVFAGVVISLVIVAVSPFAAYLFPKLSSDVHSQLKHVLWLQAAVMLVLFLNNVWIVGMFRAGGDNTFTMLMILCTTWVIALPLVFAGVYLFKLPVEWVYALFLLEEISKCAIGYWRYRSRRWMRNLIEAEPSPLQRAEASL